MISHITNTLCAPRTVLLEFIVIFLMESTLYMFISNSYLTRHCPDLFSYCKNFNYHILRWRILSFILILKFLSFLSHLHFANVTTTKQKCICVIDYPPIQRPRKFNMCCFLFDIYVLLSFFGFRSSIYEPIGI